MPRDKTENHRKIVEAAKQEFLEKGYVQASMKSVADKVGMTSAGLYRHFAGKEDMFSAMVQPALDSLGSWKENHIRCSYDALDEEKTDQFWDISSKYNEASLILDVMYEDLDTFYLLLYCSAGTVYENFLHEYMEEATDGMMEFQEARKCHGIEGKSVSREEMHMLVSAYFEALLQPIEHRYTKEKAEQYIKTIMDFFTPGWRLITGL